MMLSVSKDMLRLAFGGLLGGAITLVAQPSMAAPPQADEAKPTAASADPDAAADPDAKAQPEADDPSKESGDDEAEEPGVAGSKQPTAESDSPGASGWGIGGKEPEGKYVPKGKTGKLKKLESDDEEEETTEKMPLRWPSPWSTYVDTVIGFGDMLVVNAPTGLTNVSPTASFVIGGKARFAEIWHASLRIGVASGANNGPRTAPAGIDRDPDSYKQIAMGGIELGTGADLKLSSSMRLPVAVSFAISPFGADMWANADNRGDVAKAVVLEAAAASRGWRDRSLFVHKRFSISPSVGWEWHKFVGGHQLDVAASTRLDLMFRIGGEDPPSGSDQLGTNEAAGEARTVATAWTLGAEAFYQLLDGMVQPGLRTWLAVMGAPDALGSVIDPSGAAFLVEPAVKGHFPLNKNKSFGIDANISGIFHLAGDALADENKAASMTGFRVGAGFFF